MTEKYAKGPGTAKTVATAFRSCRRGEHSAGRSAKAHSSGNLKVPSSQTLLARNGAANNFSFSHRG